MNLLTIEKPINTVQKDIVESLSSGLTGLTKRKLSEFVNSEITVTKELNGSIIDVVKVTDQGNISDYIFQVNGNILFQDEFDYISLAQTRRESFGNQQFSILMNHFKKLHKNSIPVNTHLEIEFHLKDKTKGIAESNYRAELLSYSEQEHTSRFGKLILELGNKSTVKRQTYARELNINVPKILFKGYINTPQQVLDGIRSKQFKDIFNEYKNSLNFEDKGIFIHGFAEMLSGLGDITVSSVTGSTINDEYTFKKSEPISFKDSGYWSKVKAISAELALNIGRTRGSLNNKITELSKTVQYLDIDFTNPEKTVTNIRDDIQHITKTLIIKSLRGNNGQMVIGRFRVLTRSHVKLINKAIREYDTVTICVLGKDTDISKKMINKVFSPLTNPKIQVISVTNVSDVYDVVLQSPFNINTVLVGSDEIRKFSSKINSDFRCLGLRAQELERDPEDVSQTDIINGEDFFKNTPKQIHDMRDEILAF